MAVSEFVTRRRVEFADTDMAGIVHFSRFAIFMETAEHEFLASLGATIHREHEGRELGWPRVRMSLDFRRPARFGDELEIRLRILRKGRSSMTYGFVFSRDGEQLARGEMKSTCCEIQADGRLRAVPIPGFLADQIAEFELPDGS